MSFSKISLSNKGFTYSRFRNMGILCPRFQYVGNILNFLPIFNQYGHSVPSFNIY